MRKQITRVSIYQSSKIMAILACIISALYAIPLGIYELVNHNNDTAIALFLQPLIHFVVSFLTSIIAFFIYNQVTKVFGGLEIETNEGAEHLK